MASVMKELKQMYVPSISHSTFHVDLRHGSFIKINNHIFLFPTIYDKFMFEEKKFLSNGSGGPEKAWAQIDQ